jgi:hypothetical protein
MVNTSHYSTSIKSRGGFAGLTIYADLIYSVTKMFKDDNKLSPDYEWMLQSEQVDDENLIQALALKYYQKIYQLALTRLNYPEEAHRVAQETFLQALSKKFEFNGGTNIENWLVNIAAGICTSRQTDLQDHSFLNPYLIRSIRTRQPQGKLTDRQIENAILEMNAQLWAQKNAKSNRARFQALAMIGITVLVIYILTTMSFSGARGVPDGSSTTLTATPSSNLAAEDTADTTEELGDHPKNAASLPPLTLNSTQDEILDRIQSSAKLWNTLWADLTVTFHGPAGYVGPPFSERHQLMLDQKRGGLLAIGPTDGFPDHIERIFIAPEPTNSKIRLFGVSGYSKLGSQYPWFSIKTETVFLFPYAINYLFNITNQDLLQNVNLSIVGEQVWAGRKTVIVEISSLENFLIARLWIDTQKGTVLREQYFDSLSSGKVIVESSIPH